jgi:hypothetical protein
MQLSLNPDISPMYLFSLSLSFPLSVPLSFSDVGKEVRREWRIVQEDAGVCEGHR